MRQKESTKIDSLMNKLWLKWGTELNRKIYNPILLTTGMSPFDITALDDELVKAWLVQDGTALSEYVNSKLDEEEQKSFLILFWLD